MVSCVVLGITTAAPKADFGYGAPSLQTHSAHSHEAHDEKQCKLERAASATSPECFLEPECQNKCRDETRPVCSDYQENECQTFDAPPSCNTVNEQVCEQKYETEYENVCTTTNEQKCRDIVRNECNTVLEQKCETK